MAADLLLWIGALLVVRCSVGRIGNRRCWNRKCSYSASIIQSGSRAWPGCNSRRCLAIDLEASGQALFCGALCAGMFGDCCGGRRFLAGRTHAAEVNSSLVYWSLTGGFDPAGLISHQRLGTSCPLELIAMSRTNPDRSASGNLYPVAAVT